MSSIPHRQGFYHSFYYKCKDLPPQLILVGHDVAEIFLKLTIYTNNPVK
jgi:hypothetical protein